jgi:hypothetical protein
MRMSESEIGALHHQYITSIVGSLAKYRGTVDFFQGDHVVASFNAVKENRAHVQGAVSAALLAINKLQALQGTAGNVLLQLHVGISTGRVLCGNSGIDQLNRFGLTGPVYTDAFALASHSRQRYATPSVLVASSVREALGASPAASTMLEAVDVVPTCLYTASCDQTMQVVYRLRVIPFPEDDLFHAFSDGAPVSHRSQSDALSQASQSSQSSQPLLHLAQLDPVTRSMLDCVNACFQGIAQFTSHVDVSFAEEPGSCAELLRQFRVQVAAFDGLPGSVGLNSLRTVLAESFTAASREDLVNVLARRAYRQLSI